jgi:Acetylornithine deacetylase/Succinyl-diaminopimelate desuccinylase and related deacylases
MSVIKQRAFTFIENHRDEMLSLWQELVSIESGSPNKEGVDLVAARITEIAKADGANARIWEFERAGNMIAATYGAERKRPPVAFVGHMDTVFAEGTIDRRPFTIRDGKAFGPGALDMKGGIVVMLYAVKALQAAGYNSRPLKIILAGDEENAHAHSNAADIITQEAKGCIAAFNCETGFIDDRLVVGRQGAATFTMETHGVAAHTGNNPQGGRSAILELAHKVIDIHNLTDFSGGTLFNVGTIQGGTGLNVTPDYAKLGIGVRCTSETAMDQITSQLKSIAGKTYIEGTQTVLTAGPRFMPMTTTPAVTRLFQLVAKTACENDLGQPTPFHVGGASDSAYTVIAGTPTVCALGVKGENNHSPQEYAVVESLFERAKLLAACVLNLDNSPA